MITIMLIGCSAQETGNFDVSKINSLSNKYEIRSGTMELGNGRGYLGYPLGTSDEQYGGYNFEISAFEKLNFDTKLMVDSWHKNQKYYTKIESLDLKGCDIRKDDVPHSELQLLCFSNSEAIFIKVITQEEEEGLNIVQEIYNTISS